MPLLHDTSHSATHNYPPPPLIKCRNLMTFSPDVVLSCSIQTVSVDNTAEGGSVRKAKRQIVILHTDIIGDMFWKEHSEILDT